MTVSQKVTLSLLISVVLVAGFSVLAFTGFFNLVETRFYNPSITKSLDREVRRDAETIQDFLDELQERFAAAMEDDAVKRSFLPNQAAQDIFERTRLYGILMESQRGLQSVRFVDTGGIRLHFSTDPGDIQSQNNDTISYKNYDETTPYVPYGELSAASGDNPKITLDQQNDRIVFSFPFYDSMEIYRGTALYSLSIRAVAERLIVEGRIKIGEDLSIVSAPPGMVSGLPNMGRDALIPIISSVWQEGLFSLTALDSQSSSSALTLISAKTEKGLIVGRVVDAALFAFPQVMKVILLTAIFLTIFLTIFLAFNLRPDTMTVIQNRLKGLQLSLIREYYERKGEMDWNHWYHELELRREDVRSELKRGVKEKTPALLEDIDSLIDKSWDEILTAIGGKRETRLAIDEDKLQNILNRMLLVRGDSPVLPGGGPAATDQVINALATRAPVPGPVVPGVSPQPPARSGEPEEIETLEDVEELGEIEELSDEEEPEAVTELAGGEEPEAVTELSDEEEPEAVTELADEEEPETVAELPEAEEPEPVVAEELSEAEEPESAVAEDLTGVEEPEPIAAEDLSGVEEPEPAVAEDLTGVEEPEPIAAEGLTGVEEPGPIVAEDLTGVEEPGPAVAEDLTGVEEPEPAVAEDLTGVEEPEPAVAEDLTGVEEPEPAVEDLIETEELKSGDLEELDNAEEPEYLDGLPGGEEPDEVEELSDMESTEELAYDEDSDTIKILSDTETLTASELPVPFAPPPRSRSNIKLVFGEDDIPTIMESAGLELVDDMDIPDSADDGVSDSGDIEELEELETVSSPDSASGSFHPREPDMASQIEFSSSGEEEEGEDLDAEFEIVSPFADMRSKFNNQGTFRNDNDEEDTGNIKTSGRLEELNVDYSMPLVYKPFQYQDASEPQELKPVEPGVITRKNGINYVDKKVKTPDNETAKSLDPGLKNLVDSVIGKK